MTNRSLTNAVAAAVVIFAVSAAAVPAFAWSSGAPGNYYGETVQNSRSYYDYAPQALTRQTANALHHRKHDAR